MLIACFLLLGAFLLTLQTSFFTILPAWMGNPDLLFILIVFIAVRVDKYRGAILTLLFGLLMDIFSGISLGLYPTVFLVLFCVIKVVSHHIIITETTYQVPVVAISFVLNNIFIAIFLSVVAPGNPLIWAWRDLILQLLIISVLTMPFFHIYELLTAFISRRSGKRQSLLKVRSTGNRFI